jgi:SAM-dependent methyltransferase
VLDVATGSGEAALLVESAVGELGLVVGTDISLAMLKTACTRLAGESFLPVVADGQALPFLNACFDAILCQLGLMFFLDPTQGLVEARSVLNMALRRRLRDLHSRKSADVGSARETLCRYPTEQRLQLSFALADAGRLLDLFGVAGFRDVRACKETREGVRAFEAYWAPIEFGTGPMPKPIVIARGESKRFGMRCAAAAH